MRPITSSRRNYNRIVANQDDILPTGVTAASNALEEPLSPATSYADDDDVDENCNGGAQSVNQSGNQPTTATANGTASSLILPPPPITPNIRNEIHVTLMDGAQTKFNITCDAQWTVSEFKEVSAYITKVPPRSQRLIHMGKLLQDASTLGECGINEDGKIIHLFPKPNVVINSNTNNNNCEEGQTNNSNNNNGGTDGTSTTAGAHIPQIILDSEEASRRSQILILSSQEIFEAQHRVKLFSFLLMIISSMELLTLMTLYVGVPQEGDYPGYGGAGADGGGGGSDSLPPGNPTDTPPSSSYGNNTPMEMRTWQNSDYFDTLISAFGFYVS